MKLRFEDGHISNFDDVIKYVDNGQEDLRPLYQDIRTHLSNDDFKSSNDYDMARYTLKKIRNKVSSNLSSNQSYINDSKGVAVASIILMVNAVITAIMFMLILISRL